jgi:hypothetical protein
MWYNAQAHGTSPEESNQEQELESLHSHSPRRHKSYGTESGSMTGIERTDDFNGIPFNVPMLYNKPGLHIRNPPDLSGGAPGFVPMNSDKQTFSCGLSSLHNPFNHRKLPSLSDSSMPDVPLPTLLSVSRNATEQTNILNTFHDASTAEAQNSHSMDHVQASMMSFGREEDISSTTAHGTSQSIITKQRDIVDTRIASYMSGQSSKDFVVGTMHGVQRGPSNKSDITMKSHFTDDSQPNQGGNSEIVKHRTPADSVKSKKPIVEEEGTPTRKKFTPSRFDPSVLERHVSYDGQVFRDAKGAIISIVKDSHALSNQTKQDAPGSQDGNTLRSPSGLSWDGQGWVDNLGRPLASYGYQPLRSYSNQDHPVNDTGSRVTSGMDHQENQRTASGNLKRGREDDILATPTKQKPADDRPALEILGSNVVNN